MSDIRCIAATLVLLMLGCEERTAPPAPVPPTPVPVVTSAAIAPTTAPPTNPPKIIVIQPSTLPLQEEVKRERAEHAGSDVLIYVGAEWCEPCKRFHDAVVRGELDEAFPNLVLLEFDRDKDEHRLEAAGCITRLIPLFSRPTEKGGCDLSRSMTGSIKGPGAVANITPRLKGLLSR